MTAGIVEELDVQFGVTAKPVPKPSNGPAFPLPSGYYFGPKLPTTNARSVSGYHGRKFGGKTDREWLKAWQTQAAESPPTSAKPPAGSSEVNSRSLSSILGFSTS